MGAFARSEPIVLELTGADEERLLVLNDCIFCNRLMLLDGHPVKSCFHVMELLSDILLGYNLSLVCAFDITEEIRSMPLWRISGLSPKLWPSHANRKGLM